MIYILGLFGILLGVYTIIKSIDGLVKIKKIESKYK